MKGQTTAHEDFTRGETHEGPSNRSFGLTMGIVLAGLAVLPMLRSRPPRWWAVGPAVLLLLAAAFFPSALRWPNRVWMKLAELLARITNPIITGLMFYLVFAPLGVICRWMGKDFLRLKFDGAVDSYWIPRQPAGPPPETMRNQF
jgi:Saxitoxin biosynthesis operon protein SxtJ